MNKQYSGKAYKGLKRPSIQRHQRQKAWQILVPLAAGVLLILGVGAFVIVTAAGSTAGGPVSQWADLSFIWLILPVMMFFMIGTLVLSGLIYLIAKILNILPPYTNLVQQYAGLISARLNLITRKMVSPILSVKTAQARINGFFSALLGLTRR